MIKLNNTYFLLPLYCFNKMAPLPGIGVDINYIAIVSLFSRIVVNCLVFVTFVVWLLGHFL